jgi:LemA protein
MAHALAGRSAPSALRTPQLSVLSQLRRLALAVIALFALAPLASLTLTGCANYDVLVEKDQSAQEKWANVEAALQRRYDLIDNMVATVKGQANFEKSTIENVTKARAEASQIKMSPEALTDPEAMKRFQAAQNQLALAVSALNKTIENYPNLQANQGFHDLRVSIEGSENRLLRAREEYNAAVKSYNAELGKVRGRVVNKVTGQEFKPREYYKADAAAAVAPKVSF